MCVYGGRQCAHSLIFFVHILHGNKSIVHANPSASTAWVCEKWVRFEKPHTTQSVHNLKFIHVDDLMVGISHTHIRWENFCCATFFPNVHWILEILLEIFYFFMTHFISMNIRKIITGLRNVRHFLPTFLTFLANINASEEYFKYLQSIRWKFKWKIWIIHH